MEKIELWSCAKHNAAGNTEIGCPTCYAETQDEKCECVKCGEPVVCLHDKSEEHQQSMCAECAR